MIIEIPDKYFNEEELKNTPKRIESVKKELKSRHEFEFTTFENPGYDDLIILKDIDFTSFCSHHMLPFIGVAHIGYLPQDKICGISKLARLVDKWAARPQIQERMTAQIANELQDTLNPQGCMVILEAQHECMRSRGVQTPRSKMVTSAVRGKFKLDPSLKQEFLEFLK